MSDYCKFMFNLLEEIDEDPTNLSFQRKYDEMIAELYSFCDRWKDLIELESVYFHLKKRPDVKSGIVHFNYENPKEFVDQNSMCRLKNNVSALDLEDDFVEHVTLDNGNDIAIRHLNSVCQPKVVCENLGSNEDFRYAVKTNNIKDRLDAFLKNKTDREQVKSLPTVRFSKKEKEDKCSVCMGDFRANEELFKLQCGHIYHKKCLKSWLKKSIYCPLYKEILS